MENTAIALPALDLFGEQVVIQRRTFQRRPKPQSQRGWSAQLGFLDILDMSDAALEALRAQDEITDDYIEWLRAYLLKITLRQIVHPQVSDSTWRDALDWVLADDGHPFSFKVCCTAAGTDFELIRDEVVRMAVKVAFR